MLDKIFGSIFTVFDPAGGVTIWGFIISLAVALVLGAGLAAAYTVKNRYTKSFLITLALLPAVVGVVIMLVNGNLGAGIAVAGAFSLVRFRSTPGTAKEIVAIFIAMCVGLTIGMGFIGYAILITLIMGGIMVLFNVIKLFDKQPPSREKTLRITIPEDLNYAEVFDDLFEKYTESCENISVKTTNMGSMYKLKYNIVLKQPKEEKQFIDELRCRNGNLEVSISVKEQSHNEL